MIVNIEKKSYQVNENEFIKKEIQEYCNLNILNELGDIEKRIGLIRDISKDLNIEHVFYLNPTHGGFLPIQCSNFIKNNTVIYDVNTIESFKTHIDNINTNIKNINNGFNKINLILQDEGINNYLKHINHAKILYCENVSNVNIENYINKNNSEHLIVISPQNDYLDTIYLNSYVLKNSNIVIYVPSNYNFNFYISFRYYIDDNDKEQQEQEEKKKQFKNKNHIKRVLNYDNLIHLCIMVKNGGEPFETMLTENIHLIDKWTILDTGSTDNTIDTINKLLSRKKGTLYKESFINFRDSRNRLLEIAGNTCKYTLMLDDTYHIKGNLRYFLNLVRGDQFCDSFSLYIKSDDVEYASNRILKSNRQLKYLYRIHEVIQFENNINVIIPFNVSHIIDERYDSMETRTMNRKLLDIKLLFEELIEDPDNPRTHYYLGQTYNLLEDYENAFKWMMERVNHKNEGFLQERVDACFEAARIANFKLNKSWNEVEPIYMKAFELDKERPDTVYFLGIHYYLENNMKVAYDYLKLAYNIGYPQHKQYSLKPNLSFYYVPKFLARVCYLIEDYKLGEECSRFFLTHNSESDVLNDDHKHINDYHEMLSWHLIYMNLNKCPPKTSLIQNIMTDKYKITKSKKLLCFVADGGYESWSGSTILNKGVGGSETYIIEMARYIQQNGEYNVIVFCNCTEPEIFEGVQYLPLNEYYIYVNTNYVDVCIVSRFTQYLPVAFKGHVENVYLVLHDVSPIGNVIPMNDSKLRKIFCLTEWHVASVSKEFLQLKDIIEPFYYGIDIKLFEKYKNIPKKHYKFIYSSFPNRGLLPLLQMWPKIYKTQPLSSLDLFCDIDGKWVNETEPSQMKEIKRLFNEYKSHETNYNIVYHGWVDKETLTKHWCESDIWFYPCIFSETFCLTALEAAISKTFIITNGLAALQNTVGNRGIIIEGNPLTQEWQELAFNEIIKYITQSQSNHSVYNVEICTTKNKLINMNYDWANNLTWKNRADTFVDLLDKYNVNTNINKNFIRQINNISNLNYADMYNWTNDLPNGHKQYFLDVIDYFNKKHSIKNIQPEILEIGVYSGTSLINILNLIPNSVGTAIDKWENYKETNLSSSMIENNIENVFYDNLKSSGFDNRVIVIKGNSCDVLLDLIKQNKSFDFIYVDGSHLLLDAYTDIFLSWELLKTGGILAIDDVQYNSEQLLESPFKAVEHFMNQYNGQYKILHLNYRAFLEKI
jgi:predicted O-methyltransferase YrrM